MLYGVLTVEEIDRVGHTGSGDSTMVDVKALGRLYRRVCKIAKCDYYLRHVGLSVCLSARNTLLPLDIFS